MIYASNKFRQKFVKLSDEYKKKIISIIMRYNELSLKERPEYLVSLCGKNGNSKWSGISKTLYHLYPQMGNTTHRLFYCYATDLNNEIREKTQIIDGLILIDYTLTKNEEYRAAKNYEKGNIKYYQIFEPPTSAVNDPQTQQNVPIFWFCLTSKQDQVLNAKQPLLVKGSAGSGKTLISFELFKQWIAYTDMKKILYITYTDNLLNLAIRTLEDDGLVFDETCRFKCSKFESIYELKDRVQVIKEKEARDIIIDILKKLEKSKKLPKKILFTEYFIYAYIRGVIKGRFDKEKHDRLDTHILEIKLYEIMNKSSLSMNEQSKVFRCFNEYMKNNFVNYGMYNKKIKNKLLASLHKKDKQKLSKKLDKLFNEDLNFSLINEAIVRREVYTFLNINSVKLELMMDGLSSSENSIIIHIYEKYNQTLHDMNVFNDNDYAIYLLNAEINEEDKYDAIIVDEVQDLTEIQIEAIVKLTKDGSDNISFFGDPNQTINPTVYDYGRFNSFVYNKTNVINREYLKETHRCGPNLLEYINHLNMLRREFQITNEKEDLKPEKSAIKKIDTYWACLIEDNKLIEYILEVFVNAEDCYLIVDNHNTRSNLIKRINEITNHEHEGYVEDQIITIQDAKGLESKNVIIYNLISDNIDIFNNILNENSKVSSMTFNKLYVSCTRARDSLLICEENLEKATHIRNKLFFFNGKSMAEDINEDDVGLYLSISFDPQVFYDQALNAIDNYDYIKGLKKNNIALQNIVNQFDYSKVLKEEHPFAFIETYLRNSKKYNLLMQSVNIKRIRNLKKYYDLFEELVLNDYLNEEDVSKDEINFLKDRLQLLENSIQTQQLCSERNDFDALLGEMDEDEKLSYIKGFIQLNDYNCTEHAVFSIINSAYQAKLLRMAKYIFNLSSFKDVSNDILDMGMLNEEISRKIIRETNIVSDCFSRLEEDILEMEELIYE